MNKSQLREILKHIVFIDKWPNIEGYIILKVILFYLIKEELLQFGLYLQDGHYSEIVFNPVVTVFLLFLDTSSLCNCTIK